jgi:uncharacterized protein (TIGR03790 family)
VKKLLFIFTILAGGMCALSRASNPGDEVVVVYNSSMPESKAIAEYYAQRRQVPANQLFGFDVTTNQDISRRDFQDGLQQPLAKALEANHLWHIASRIVETGTNHVKRVEWRPVESKIRYVVLCYGIPLRIEAAPNLKEEGTEKLRPEMQRNEAAVDNELAVLPLIEDKPMVAGPLNNPAYTTTNIAKLNPTNGVLMVARLDGPTPAIARGLVDKALEAERDGLWGRAYFDVRNTTESGFKLGDEWIRGASEICKRLGFETVVDENPGTFPAGFPMSQIAIYEGWYNESASGPFAQPTVEFMPGAFAYHLHSFSAATLRSTNKFWAGPLLAKGATVTMGSVWEPYLAGTPDVRTFTARFIFQGFTFGEAAYAGLMVLSWQTTVVGDPLYRPFGKDQDKVQLDLEQQHSKYREWSYLRLVDLNLATGKPAAQMISVLEQLPLTRTSAVLSEKLGDMYAAQGKPSSAVHEYIQSLKLDPSPQQRLGLRLTLGEKLVPLDRENEAFDNYVELLREMPDYPDKLAIEQKLLPLAQKLNKKTEAEFYQAEIRKLTAPQTKVEEQRR